MNQEISHSISPRLLLVVSFIFLFVGCGPYITLTWAREQLLVGTLRPQVIEVLGKVSWYHQACIYKDEVVEDLFFYGSHKYDQAEVFIVDYKKLGENQWEVSQIGSLRIICGMQPLDTASMKVALRNNQLSDVALG
jgi:hypothetical protein